MSAALEIREIRVRFGGVTALDGLSANIPAGRITALIGPNGSGKTTLFNAITGFAKPNSGSIHLDGHPITGLAPAQVARRGVARTFQGARLFRSLTVEQNLLYALRQGRGEGVWEALLGRARSRRRHEELRAEVDRMLTEVGLESHRNRPASALSFGQAKLLEVQRCFATGARLLLLDEPAAGLSPGMLERLRGLLGLLHARGTTVVFVEHHMGFVSSLADHVVALVAGRKAAEGTPQEVRSHQELVSAYLGRRRDEPC